MAWSTIILPAVALIFSSLIKDSITQTITTSPENTAARLGDSAQLNCTVDRGSDTLEWRHFIGSPTGERIYDSTTGNIRDQRFDVLQVGSGEYDLVIKDAQSGLAGLYRCGLIVVDQTASAQLVTVSQMTRSPLPGQRTVVENTEMTLTCEVTFHGYKAPTLEWYNDQEVPLPTNTRPDDVDPQKHIATTNLTARADNDMKDFECRLKFINEAGDSGNPPSYTDSITTNFMVNHAVTAIMISPDPDNVPGGKINIDIGDQINCSASGRPEPTYHWHMEDGSNIVQGQYLVITEAMAGEHTYRCEATNVINGVERKAQKSVTFIATAPSPPPVTTAGTPGWIIAVAVVVPVVVIIAVLIGVFVALKHHAVMVEKASSKWKVVRKNFNAGLPLGILILSTLCRASSAQSFDMKPVNTAAKIGERAQFNCTADDESAVLVWSEFITDVTGRRIFQSSGGNVEIPPEYDVEVGGDGEYNLIIRSTDYSLAGLYECSLIIEDESAPARFVAITEANCGPTGLPTLVEGQEVSLTCQVTYRGEIQPNMQFFSPAGEFPGDITSEYDEVNNRYTRTLISNITSVDGTHDDVDFRCDVFFNDNTFGPPPIYRDNCTTSFYVTHPPRNVMISPDPGMFENDIILISYGEMINCSASGRPEPSYSWRDEDQVFTEIHLGPSLPITQDMVGLRRFTCIATNDIGGTPRESSTTFTMDVKVPDDAPVAAAGTPGWVIAVAVVVPILVIVAVLIVVYMVMRRNNSLPDWLGGDSGGKGPAPQYGDGPHGGGIYPSEPPPGVNRGYQGEPTPRKQPPPANQDGVRVLPPSMATDQHMRTGRDSPGYGDLGIRHFGGSGTSMHDVSMDSMGGPPQVQTRPNPNARGSSGFDNRNFHGADV